MIQISLPEHIPYDHEVVASDEFAVHRDAPRRRQCPTYRTPQIYLKSELPHPEPWFEVFIA